MCTEAAASRRAALACLLAVLGLAGAGCSGQGQRQAAAAAAGTAHASYRWLVPTAGTPLSIAQENRAPGTRRWRLPGPAADVGGLAHGGIAGYVAYPSLKPGQTQRIYVSAPGARRVRITLFRMGWYGGRGGREVLSSRWLHTRRQPPCPHDASTGLTECHWHPTLAFSIPPSLTSGVYIAKLTSDRRAEGDCLFVVQSARPAPVLAQLPTATYEAYNAWGGDSLYPGGAQRVAVTGTTQGVQVSYDRPYASVTGAGEFFARDVAMIRFLERYGYPVDYTDSESVAREPAQLQGHRALLDFGHSEYWSQGQADAWTQRRDGATSLLFLSSDTLGWRVRYGVATSASSEAGQAAHVIVAYKEHAALDPDRAAPTGAFPGHGAPVTGAAYVGCITPRVARPGPPAYRYYPWSPAPGLRPAWLFAGSGVSAATRIAGITGYELDQRTAATPPGTVTAGGGSAPCMSVGASGPGEPVPPPGPQRADTTLYSARSGALVFSTGTLGWELGLEPVPSASPDAPVAPDPRVVTITRNVLDRVLRRR